MNKKVSILVPMYNEEKIAEKSAKTLQDYFGQKFQDGEYEIIFCNDGSKDSCAEKVENLNLPNVRVVGYSDNRGKGAVIRYGIAMCEGEYIVCTDCDIAYGLDAIYEMANRLIEGKSEMVIGSRNISKDGYDGYTPLRRLMSKAYIKVICILAGFKYSDSQCGIKGYKAERAKSIFRKCTVNGFAYDLEVLILADKMGISVSEMPVKIINHSQSDSKVRPIIDGLKMARDVLKIKKMHKNVKRQV